MDIFFTVLLGGSLFYKIHAAISAADLYDTGLSIRAATCNTSYSWVCLMNPWCYRRTCLHLIQFTPKVTSLLWVWQVNQNFLTALQSITNKYCKAVPGYFNLWFLLILRNNMHKSLRNYRAKEGLFAPEKHCLCRWIWVCCFTCLESKWHELSKDINYLSFHTKKLLQVCLEG